MTNITLIARNMSRTIPKPRAKIIKQAKSWRTLKPEQYLVSNLALTNDGAVADAGSLWYISAVNSSGIDIATISLKPVKYHWEIVEWKDYFKKIRKPSRDTLVSLLVKELPNA